MASKNDLTIREAEKIQDKIADILQGYNLCGCPSCFPNRRFLLVFDKFVDKVVWIRNGWNLTLSVRWLHNWVKRKYLNEKE